MDGSPVNGVRLTYDPTLVTQRALYMQGGIGDYNTPGVFRQLGTWVAFVAFAQCFSCSWRAMRGQGEARELCRRLPPLICFVLCFCFLGAYRCRYRY